MAGGVPRQRRRNEPRTARSTPHRTGQTPTSPAVPTMSVYPKRTLLVPVAPAPAASSFLPHRFAGVGEAAVEEADAVLRVGAVLWGVPSVGALSCGWCCPAGGCCCLAGG